MKASELLIKLKEVVKPFRAATAMAQFLLTR